MKKHIGVLVGDGIYADNMFDPDGERNRDDCLRPYIELRSEFKKYNIDITTKDMVSDPSMVTFEIHQDVSDSSFLGKKYCILFETGLVKPLNDKVKDAGYSLVFGWDERLSLFPGFVKQNFPNPCLVRGELGYLHREQLICLIAGNKSLSVASDLDLYCERVRAIKWFEHNHIEDFYLYGVGWEVLAAKPGVLNKIFLRLYRAIALLFDIKPFPSYSGEVVSKKIALEKSRFSICFENVNGQPGYITEKIFDCFFSKNVPVYLGAPDIEKYVPKSCFVDMRDFNNYRELYKYLLEMPESEYIEYQQCAMEFLASDSFYQFSSECFAKNISQKVARDLGCE